MKKFVLTLLTLLTVTSLSAQELTREQMQDSIIVMLSGSTNQAFIALIQKSDKALKEVSSAKLDCAIEKEFGLNEQRRNNLVQYLQSLSDSEVQRYFAYVKLSTRRLSPEYNALLQEDVLLSTFESLGALSQKSSSGKQVTPASAIKTEEFTINDKETETYVSGILKNTIGLNDAASQGMEMLSKGEKLDANQQKDVADLLSSTNKLTIEYHKKNLLLFYTKQELKQMYDFESNDKEAESFRTQLNSEENKSRVMEIFEKLSTINWAEKVSKVTDAEVAVYAHKYLSFLPHANPVPREKMTLTIDGGQYTGEVWNGEANGVGEFVDAKGNSYTGDFIANKMDGYGVMVTAKGKKTTGYWKQGKYLGEQPKDTDYGYHVKNEVFQETGIYKHGKLCGNGSISLEGTKLSGLFEEGKMKEGTIIIQSSGTQIAGKGAFDITASGTGGLKYTFDEIAAVAFGYFANANLIGRGTMIRQKTDKSVEERFDGFFIDGIMVGKGEYVRKDIFKDGSTREKHYNGYYFNNYNGEGTETSVSSDKDGISLVRSYVYEGEFKDGNFHGKGILTVGTLSNSLYVEEGEFKDGYLHGEGTLTYPDGSKVVGSWIKGKLSGMGTIIFSDGTSFEGKFFNGSCVNGIVKDKQGKVISTGASYSM